MNTPDKTRYAVKRGPAYNKLLALLLLLIFAERIYVLCELGPMYCSGADDINYVPSGIFFADTGILAYDNIPVQSALIMPGMPLVIGFVSLIFGDGVALWASLKVLWSLFGTLTALYVYKTVTLSSPKWCGLVTILSFLLPNLAWMNNVILTETPYALALTMCIYYTVLMGRSSDRRYFVAYLFSVLFGLLFRSNMLAMFAFSAAYVLLVRKSARCHEFIRRVLFTCGVLVILLAPWAVRNYIQFDAFVPMTYGVGNPLLLGTYQGENFPSDESLDYETNVYAVVREKYAKYFDSAGNVVEARHEEYLKEQTDAIKAKYRISEWLKSDPLSYIKSILFTKPRFTITWVWYWTGVMGVDIEPLHLASQINFVLCCVAVALSLVLKKCRREVFLLCLVYWGNMLVNSFGFMSDRYAAMYMPARYILMGIGFYLMAESARQLRKRSPVTLK